MGKFVFDMYVKLKAYKSAEGNAYYCDLPNGERLVIRNGELEGIYDPGKDDEDVH